MFSSKIVLTSLAIRTPEELKKKVPIGGIFWIMSADIYTHEPNGIICIRREGAESFSYGGDEDEEDCMPTIWEVRRLTEDPYGGAWLKEKDAKAYLMFLQDCWKQTYSVINAYAQSEEKRLSH